MRASRDVILQQARDEYKLMLDLTEPFHRVYAERHGVEYKRVDGTIVHGWNGTWDAIALFVRMIDCGVDRIFWLDADTLIVGDEDLHSGLSGAPLTMARHPGPPGHWNCGVLFIDVSPRVSEFFEETLRRGPGGYPWWQQQIMNDLLALPEWDGMIGRLGDRWNSTVGHVEAPDPVVMAWHGTSGPVNKYRAMREYVRRNEPIYTRAGATQGRCS